MRFALAATALAVSGSAALAEKPKPKLTKKKTVQTAAAKGFWKILVQPNAKWVLKEETSYDPTLKPSTITVETYDVRKVGAADVARLRWTLIQPDGTQSDVGDNENGRYTQVAVTPAGLYILWAAQDDAKVAKMLEGKPSRSDPPKPYEGTKLNEGRYLYVNDDGTVCLGQGPEPGAGDCPDTCDGTMCLSPTKGVIQLIGNWAPGVTVYNAE